MITIELLNPEPGKPGPDPEHVKNLLLKALSQALWHVADSGPTSETGWTDEDYCLMRDVLYANDPKGSSGSG